jgi:hypothetical protein
MATKNKVERPKFGPASEKQKLILQDTTTDVILIGGKHSCLQY